MREIWDKIESQLRRTAPDLLRSLNPGASAASIDAAEKSLGITFPQDVRESYLIHDGQTDDAPNLFDTWSLLSLDAIVREWKVWKQLTDSGEFKKARSGPGAHHASDWWNPAWIPLTYNGAGDHHCLDLAPTPKGAPGQIIQMIHDDADRTLVGYSYR
jgi:cell wall assembly regulator SMI1